MRNWALAISVFTAALIAHPSFERPGHGPPSRLVADVIDYRYSGGHDLDVDCRPANSKRVYHCDIDVASFATDTFTLSYRVAVR